MPSLAGFAILIATSYRPCNASLKRHWYCMVGGQAVRPGRDRWFELGVTTPTLDALISTPPTDGLRDKVLHIDTVFRSGFVKPFPKWVFGSSEKAFGTAGFGGSFGFADPDTSIGFAYAMNRLGFHIWSDPRELALTAHPLPRHPRNQGAGRAQLDDVRAKLNAVSKRP